MAGAHYPKLVVFDLDCTLWPFHIDSYGHPPFQKNSRGEITDRSGNIMGIFRDVPQIFKLLKSQNILIGVASRTHAVGEAHALVDILGWKNHVSLREIYPGCKVPHFQSLQHKTGIPFHDMVFFDDENRNIRDVSRLGVTCIHAKKGMSMDVFQEGMRKFAESHQNGRAFQRN